MSKYDLKVDSEDVKNFLNRIYGDPFQSYGLITTSLIDRIINDIKEKEKMKNAILIKQIDEKTVVAACYESGDRCELKYIQPTLKAEAKCAPEDRFDFQAGAKLAFERLMKKIEEKNKLKPTKLYGILSGSFYGNVGELSPYHDKNGTQLYVGDVVYIPLIDRIGAHSSGGYYYVAKKVNGEFFISGMNDYCYPRDGKLDSAIRTIVEKKKSYKDILIGESHCCTIAQ